MIETTPCGQRPPLTWPMLGVLVTLFSGSGCAADPAPERVAAPYQDPCVNAGTDGATVTCLKPTKPPEWYADQASKYFDTLDTSADPSSVPMYAPDVARWEWPPWLLLTGYGKQAMITTSNLLKKGDPSTVPIRDCRFFPVQPFARCYVVFEYEGNDDPQSPHSGGPCPIYEEFTFNDAGEMTFIEAWSDLPGLTPIKEGDKWAEHSDIGRLSTRVPGLGKPDGQIDLEGEWMKAAAAKDKDVAEFAKRAKDQWTWWSKELAAAPKNFFATGCGWTRKK